MNQFGLKYTELDDMIRTLDREDLNQDSNKNYVYAFYSNTLHNMWKSQMEIVQEWNDQKQGLLPALNALKDKVVDTLFGFESRNEILDNFAQNRGWGDFARLKNDVAHYTYPELIKSIIDRQQRELGDQQDREIRTR